MSSNTLTGWYERATPLPNPTNFTPNPEILVLSTQINSMMGTIPTLSLFLPNIAVDENGRTLSLQQDDFNNIIQGARRAAQTAPQEEQFFQWRVEHPITCMPITNVFVKNEGAETGDTGEREGKEKGDQWAPIRVYGFSKSTRKLTGKVGEHEELPDAVYDLYSSVEEANSKRGDEKDLEMVERVKEVVNSFQLF